MLSSKSDEEIGWMLDDYGIKHGPVVDSTRALYEKKLREAMSKQRRKPQSDRTYYREEAEEITYVHRPRPVQYDFVSDRRTRPDYRGRNYTDEPPMYRADASYRNTSQARNFSPESQSQKPPENGSTGTLPVWLQMLVFLIVSGLLYLVFTNMEPAEPIKRLT